MEGGGAQRLPVGHPQRCRARDKKLLEREELTAMETSRQWCPCRLCCRTTQLMHSTVISHLRRFGRHERCRATMWVSSCICDCVVDVIPISCRFMPCWLTFILRFVALHLALSFVVEGPKIQFAWSECGCDADECDFFLYVIFKYVFCGYQEEAEDSSDEEWIAYEHSFRTNLSEFGGGHGLPPLDPHPIVVPLDVHIEMTQLISDAFRRRDASDRQDSEQVAHGENTAEAAHAATEEDMEDLSSEEEDDCGDIDGGEEFGEEEVGHGATEWDFPPPEADGGDGGMDDDLLQKLSEADKIPLFAGATVSLLGAVLVVLTICKTHGVSNACVDELMKALSSQILPQPNTLPVSERQATRLLRTLGLGYNIIHACIRGCVLYRGDYAGLNRCPTCHAPRFYRRGRDKKPVRVLRHFPLIPRLRRMFGTQHLSTLMTWWSENRSTDGSLRNVADSPAWRHVDDTWDDFARDARNVRLILSTDGVNPFSFKTTSWATWPVVMFIANLPPWAMTKKNFILLTLLISGPTAPSSTMFDTFLAPLVDELLTLWNPGVWVYDALAREGKHWFVMRAVCLYTVSDFPALGLISGCATKGYVACPHCGPNTSGRYSHELRKTTYGCQHRKWLGRGHPFRDAVDAFDGFPEYGRTPPSVTATQILEWARERDNWLQDERRVQAADPVRRTGIKRRSLLYDLPYWEVQFLG